MQSKLIKKKYRLHQLQIILTTEDILSPIQFHLLSADLVSVD